MNIFSLFDGLKSGRTIMVAIAFIIAIFALPSTIYGEGSVDYVNYPGMRLMVKANSPQQFKVYAAEGEFVNFGSSHVGITGGFIKIYQPDGTLHSTWDGTGATAGFAVINNDTEEKAGPTGGGTTLGTGYIPAVVQVLPGQGGIWTVTFEYPTYTDTGFSNIANNAPWSRDVNQPTNMRVVLAWDITISTGTAANAGGVMKKGRVYSNDYYSIVSQNGNVTSPTYYVLTIDGYLYKLDCKDTDPWGFPVYSNNVGIVNGGMEPQYKSMAQSTFQRSIDPAMWTSNSYYLYEPQAEDMGSIINNKVFFNAPDPDMPATAKVTDIFRNDTHTTWLFNLPPPEATPPTFNALNAINPDNGAACAPSTGVEVGKGGYFVFESLTPGTISVSLDMNNNGSFDDPIDITYSKFVLAGLDSLFWDGKNKLGEVIPATSGFSLKYRIQFKGGEVHIMMADVENNIGGFSLTRMNGQDSPTNLFYYDHSLVGGAVSGNGQPGAAVATANGFTYGDNFGNEKLLDSWAFLNSPSPFIGTLIIDIVESCTLIRLDSDNDGVEDIDDIDDDNDGITDRMEFCNSLGGGFTCLFGALDPSRDEDNDNIPNYLDAADPAVVSLCVDLDNDGKCDKIARIYDHDGDNVPDHLDLDSDNDGIPDMVEAGHNQPDADRNGVIDGEAAIFGTNGLYNPIDAILDSPSSTVTYTRWDWDTDGVPDHDDVDADNDGIFDVAEAGYGPSDTNADGMIDDGDGNAPVVSVVGYAPIIDPIKTGLPINLPPDIDGDVIPDWHDRDSDNDGINDVSEVDLVDLDNDGVVGSGILQVDEFGKAFADASGILPNATSSPIDSDNDSTPDWHDIDSDNDNLMDVTEAGWSDSDEDGIVGTGPITVGPFGQAISDPNGPLMVTSNPRDLDNDGKEDFRDVDRDGDGIPDWYECEGNVPCTDTDLDGTPDVDDLDTDGDGLTDIEECPTGAPCNDTNNNGVLDWREFTCTAATTPVANANATIVNICVDASGSISIGNSASSNSVKHIEIINPAGISLVASVTSLPYIYTWESAEMAMAGTYQFLLISDKECKSMAAPCQLKVNDTPNTPKLSVEGNIFCEGSLVEFNTEAASTTSEYNWYYLNAGVSSLVATTNEPTFFLQNVQATSSGQYYVVAEELDCPSQASNVKIVDVYNVEKVDAKNDVVVFTTVNKQEVRILDNDDKGAPEYMTFEVTLAPKYGIVTFENGKVYYEPNADFGGEDRFTYSLCGNPCEVVCDRADVVIYTDNDCKVPNILTPNGDNSNDFLVVPCLWDAPNSVMKIYNRWGDKVFEEAPYAQRWDASYRQKPLPAGTYYYIMSEDKNTGETTAGFISIVR